MMHPNRPIADVDLRAMSDADLSARQAQAQEAFDAAEHPGYGIRLARKGLALIGGLIGGMTAYKLSGKVGGHVPEGKIDTHTIQGSATTLGALAGASFATQLIDVPLHAQAICQDDNLTRIRDEVKFREGVKAAQTCMRA